MPPDKDLLLQMLERMWRIRIFEETVIEIHSTGELQGPAHPYIGEEAVAVGACAALKDTDAGVRRNAVLALGHIGEKAAPVIPAIVGLLQDHDARTRRNTVIALGLIGEKATAAETLSVFQFDANLLSKLDNGVVQLVATHNEPLAGFLIHRDDDVAAVAHTKFDGKTRVADGFNDSLCYRVHYAACAKPLRRDNTHPPAAMSEWV